MEYLILFDENGFRQKTVLVGDKTQEKIDEFLRNGFELVSEDDFQLLIGNKTGMVHVRDSKTGEFREYAPPEPTAEELQAQALAQAKAERAEAVKTITVEVAGLIFDGDEDSQTRMARTITASQALGLPEDSTISWAMADTNANKVEQVTIAQLSKALYLAGCKQSELWCKPYGVTGTTQTGLEYLNSLGQ